MLESGPLRLDFRWLDPFEEETRFKKQFGWFFDFNRERRLAVYQFQRDADATTSDIKLYRFTGNLQFLDGRVYIDKAALNFTYRFGLSIGVSFALLFALLFVVATPIPSADIAESARRLASSAMLVILAVIGYVGFIRPKMRLDQLKIQ